MRFPADGERGHPAKVTVTAKPGDYLQTNIVTMPQLVQLDGARIVGRQEAGEAVVQVSKDVKPGPVVLTLRAAHPWPVTGGAILSLLGLAGLALNGVAIAIGARRRRHQALTPSAMPRSAASETPERPA